MMGKVKKWKYLRDMRNKSVALEGRFFSPVKLVLISLNEHVLPIVCMVFGLFIEAEWSIL